MKQQMNLLSKFLIAFLTLFSSSCVFASSLKVGDMAPDFNLQGTDGRYYKLSDYKNKQAVVLAWYPMANTRGCTIECRSLVQKGDLIRSYDVSYFMASVDPIDANIDFAEKTEADFPMLSDPDKNVAKAYDVLNVFQVANRVTFYIGTNGRILKIDEHVNPETAAEDMARYLEALKTATAPLK